VTEPAIARERAKVKVVAEAELERLLPKRGASTTMSVYVTGGTVGLATGPIIGIVAFGLFGMRGTALMLGPEMPEMGARMKWRVGALRQRV